jgi:hypothetical protein
MVLVTMGMLQVLAALACDLALDTLPCCAETHKWAWFRRYCTASRVAVALDKRSGLPRPFLDEVGDMLLLSMYLCLYRGPDTEGSLVTDLALRPTSPPPSLSLWLCLYRFRSSTLSICLYTPPPPFSPSHVNLLIHTWTPPP